MTIGSVIIFCREVHSLEETVAALFGVVTDRYQGVSDLAYNRAQHIVDVSSLRVGDARNILLA